MKRVNTVKSSLQFHPRKFFAAICRILPLLILVAYTGISMPAGSTEIEASVTDDLSRELGFPIYSWSSQASPQGVILAIHGATLHGRSYTKISEFLSGKGYSVFAPDLRGFGAWYHNSDPNDVMAKQVIYSQSEADLYKLSKKLHELYPGKPVILMGESVGANMAVKLMAEHPDSAEGMILSGTAIKQRLFFGPHTFLQMLTVFFVNRKAQLDITPYLKSRVSESPQITEERINDPLGRTKMDVVELFKTRFFNKDCLKLLPNVPDRTAVLVLEGAEDKLFHADDVNNLMAQIPCPDKTLHLLKGRGHINLETMYIPDEVENLVQNWLADKCPRFTTNHSATALSTTEHVSSSSSNDAVNTKAAP